MTSRLVHRLEEVQRRAARGMSFGTERMQAALARLGDPQDAVCTVHVAGTNGKGSTCAMIESIARTAGLSTGLYTSPHLCRFAERICLGGQPVDDTRFLAALDAVLDSAPDLTFFETLTAVAFVAFQQAKVDLAVIEVGLGGRLDATNTIQAPLATAITSIGFDHTDLLGGTLAEIAREKAGIFRRGVPFVVGSMPDEARRAVAEVARTIGAGPQQEAARRIIRRVGLVGPHQIDNARVAVAVGEILAGRFHSIASSIDAGLASVTWPGRFERIARGDVTVILDCAHNEDGARSLVATLETEGLAPAQALLVFGALVDKDYEQMLRLVAPRALRRFYTAPKGRAPAPFAELVAVAPGEVEEDPRRALDRAIAAARPGESIVVTGSSYLVGELRAVLLGIDADPIIPL